MLSIKLINRYNILTTTILINVNVIIVLLQNIEKKNKNNINK